MITVIFIRHGATAGNMQKRYIGATDEPLCDVGIEQALHLRKHNFPSEHIFVSPMKRARQTAEIIFPDCKYTVAEELRETDFGAFEGKNASELSQDKDYRVWVDSMCTLPIPNGEDIKQFKKRCTEAYCKIVKTIPDGSAVSFVVHGGVIMAILEHFAEAKGNFYDYHIQNGEFIVCKFGNNTINYRSE